MPPGEGKADRSWWQFSRKPYSTSLIFNIYNFYDSESDQQDLKLNDAELAKIINKEFYQFLERHENKKLEHRLDQ